MAVYPSIISRYFIYGIRLTYDPKMEYRYVGLSSTGVTRLKAHLYNAQNTNNTEYHSAKYRWVRKHYTQVTFDILEIMDDTLLLPISEMKWIHILKGRGHRLLNNTDGGEGIWGYKHSPQTKELLSDQAKGRTASTETRQKMSESRYGKSPSAETRRKLSEAHSGPRNSMHGKKLTEDQKAKISKALTGRTHSAETRKKMSESAMGHSRNKGVILSAATREAISASKKGDKNPNYGGKSISPETRLRMAESAKRSNHKRWHSDRNVVSDTCKLCFDVEPQ